MQDKFDKCILDNLGQERPENGYFSKVRIHDSSRPKPVQQFEFPPVDPRIDQKVYLFSIFLFWFLSLKVELFTEFYFKQLCHFQI